MEYLLFSLFYWVIPPLLVQRLSRQFDKRVFFGIATIHYLVVLYYMVYSLSNPADARAYFEDASRDVAWHTHWNLGYDFVVAFLYPFVQWLTFSYIMSYLPYALVGLASYYLLLKYIRRIFPTVNSRWSYVLWLPQLHFFTCAIGKDSLIFFGICLMAISIFPRVKWGTLVMGIIIVTLVRLHITVFFLAGLVCYYILVSKMTVYLKVFLVGAILAAFLIVFPIFNEFVGLGKSESYTEYVERRQGYNTDAGSSVDVANQNFVIKALSYVGRPLFFDANSILMLEASIENIVWLFMFLYVLCFSFRRWSIARSVFVFILPMLTFLIPNAILLTNLGIAMRQKTMLFPFLYLAFICFQYSKKTSKMKDCIIHK